MLTNWRKKLAIALILTFGVFLFYFGTEGFTTFTVETARVIDLFLEKPAFPNVTLEDSKKRVYTFSDFDDQNVLNTFIYTSCRTCCMELELSMAQVYI